MDSVRKITIYDIAREAGISASQVSRAISGRGYVSEENRAKVQSLINKYNYRPNSMARSLQQGKSNLIGFMLPHIAAEYFATTYYEFEKQMMDKGYITMVFNGKSYIGDELKALHIMEEIRVEAVVVMGGSLDAVEWNPQYLKELQALNSKIPCILCTARAGELGCPGVYADVDMGIRELAEHLGEQGYKSMGILGGLDIVYPSVYLQDLLRRYAGEYGMEIRPEWEVRSSYNAEDGAEAMKKLLQQGTLPEVVCCINDDIATGAMGVAMDHGLRIPQDIAFTGRDGIRIGKVFRPRLTTVQLDFQGMGRHLADTVERRLSGSRSTELTLIKTWLEVRESTKR